MNHLRLSLRQGVRSPCRAVCVAAAALVACVTANAQIYTGTDAAGTPVLTNFSSDGSTVLLLIAGDPLKAPARPAATAAASAQRSLLAPKLLEPAIREAARRHSVSEALLTVVIAVESGFDPRAVSPKGAKGLMQPMPDTARRFGAGDVFAVLRCGRRCPAYRETQPYVAKVLAYASRAAERETIRVSRQAIQPGSGVPIAGRVRHAAHRRRCREAAQGTARDRGLGASLAHAHGIAAPDFSRNRNARHSWFTLDRIVRIINRLGARRGQTESQPRSTRRAFCRGEPTAKVRRRRDRCCQG